MFRSLLVANRGEIACRVMRTARRLGMRTIAVYSEADRDALHVRHADEAWPIGPAPAGESYLSVPRLVAAIRASGAEAVHPGYGFLSENAAFAEAVAAAGAVFVGPPPDAIRAMGSKSGAKALMAAAGVPVVPGYHGDDQSAAVLRDAADRIGYPVLIKASAGGGGRGMRVVTRPGDFAAAAESARREAGAAFADDRLLVERYLSRPRHIEVQVFADRHGGAVHLFERDCSVQRRHQKVLEEAPAPGLSPERRRSMGEAAVAAARAIAYEGAGTVEFIAEGEDFYFMEMNTRLQVEHPVTEMIVGEDLVEWQLRVAAGEPLPRGQDDLAIDGHAIEARIYAEDPDHDFRPATGRLELHAPPPESAHVRVDTGVVTGDSVTVHYDPMIAKLVVWDRDRATALARLSHALAGYRIAGLTTNLAFLARAVVHPAFRAGDVDTGFILRHAGDLFPAPAPAPDETLAIACLDRMLALTAPAGADGTGADAGDPWSPWSVADGWRLGQRARRVLDVVDGERSLAVAVAFAADGYRMRLGERSLRVSGMREADGTVRAEIDGRRVTATVVRHGDGVTVLGHGASHRLRFLDPLVAPVEAAAGGGRLTAPMPGRVTRVHVAAGDTVTRGQALLVLEAMKMEHTITAPAAGTVERVRFGEGELVEEGAELLVVAVTGEAPAC